MAASLPTQPTIRPEDSTRERPTRGAIDQALACEQLLRIAGRQEVAFDAYLRELCGELVGSFGMMGGPTLSCTASGELLPIDMAIRLGLVADELITNAFRHAFPAGQGGRITVSFTAAAEAWQLTVEDSGIGIGPEASLGGAGLTIAQALLGQLGGRLETPYVTGGTCCIASVPRSLAGPDRTRVWTP